MQEQRPEVAEDVEHGAAEGERKKPESDVPQDTEVIPSGGDRLRRRRGPTAGERQANRDGEQIQAAPQDERRLPTDRDREHGPTAHPQDDARIAEGALESHRPVESGSLEFAADPGDPDGMVEARADARDGHQDEEGPETGRQGDEERAEAEDRDPDREEPGRISPIRHDAEEELEDRGHDEGDAAEEADLRGPETAELGLQDDDLACKHCDGAVVRQVVNRIGEEDPAVAAHPARDARSAYRISPGPVRAAGGPPVWLGPNRATRMARPARKPRTAAGDPP